MDKKHISALSLILILAIVLIIPIYLHKSNTLGTVSIYEMGEVSIGGESKNSINVNSSQNIHILPKSMYAIDKKTGMPSDLFDTANMAKADLHINMEETGAKVLIFHTHGSEMYADSKNVNEGVIGAGEHLRSILEDKYGIECIHLTDRFDVVDGKLQRDGAYERAEPVVKQVLQENPSIQLVIDLHRDGVNSNLHLATTINGESYAKIMFFNGICRKWDNGKLVEINDLPNPYVKTNLALSYQMYNAVSQFDNSILRKIYINAYRYSLHLKDKSMLVELGAQTNSYEEALNSVEVIGEALVQVIGGKE